MVDTLSYDIVLATSPLNEGESVGQGTVYEHAGKLLCDVTVTFKENRGPNKGKEVTKTMTFEKSWGGSVERWSGDTSGPVPGRITDRAKMAARAAFRSHR